MMINGSYFHFGDYTFQLGHSYVSGEQIAQIFWVAFFTALAVSSVIAIIGYVFRSLGLYRMAKNRGISAPGLAWVPIAYSYLLGKVSDDISLNSGKRTHKRVVLLIFTILFKAISVAVLIFLPYLMEFLVQFVAANASSYDTESMRYVLGVLLMILAVDFVVLAIEVVYLVFYLRALYIIFKDTVPQSAAGLIVLCIFVSVAVGPVLFAIRNKPSQSAIWAKNYAEQQRIQAEWIARQQAQNEPPQAPEDGGQTE